MRNKGKNPSPKLQEKREKLIELSVQAKKLRQQKIDNATTAEEAAFWASRTVNYMLLHHIYTEGGGVRFETFNQWKEEGATIRKGAKATVIWGQPRQGIATQEQVDATPNAEPTEDTTAAEYEFFPLCFLFSEDDVYFTNAEQTDDTPAEAVPAVPAPPVIDNAAFNDL